MECTKCGSLGDCCATSRLRAENGNALATLVQRQGQRIKELELQLSARKP